ncbi:unnamed protein product [Rotaria sp. Silwood2]|nr:unnamed protein product [Rotaria sp. Silwood2]
MILLDRNLENFHIGKTDIEDIKKDKGLLTQIRDTVTDVCRLTKTYDTIYDLIHDKRNDLFKAQYEENRKYVEQAKEKYEISHKFLLSHQSSEYQFH